MLRRRQTDRSHSDSAWSSVWRETCDQTAVNIAYSDWLLRWGLYTSRSDLLIDSYPKQSARSVDPDVAHDSLSEFSWPSARALRGAHLCYLSLAALSICGRCNYEIRDDIDQACSCGRQKFPACAFCRLPVIGELVALPHNSSIDAHPSIDRHRPSLYHMSPHTARELCKGFFHSQRGAIYFDGNNLPHGL